MWKKIVLFLSGIIAALSLVVVALFQGRKEEPKKDEKMEEVKENEKISADNVNRISDDIHQLESDILDRTAGNND